MRYLYIVLIVLLTAMVLSFKIQNFESVTLTLWTSTFTLPASVLVIGVYILGMLTGGFLLSLLRSAFRGATGRPAGPPPEIFPKRHPVSRRASAVWARTRT